MGSADLEADGTAATNAGAKNAGATNADSRTIRLAGGRLLGVAEYGLPQGKPFFYFHGHPGARLEAKFLDEAARKRGLRLIGVDRPGLGLSTYQPGRRLLDWPYDVAELADQFGISRFGVVGLSGGGPYALACAYSLPRRLLACGVISGVGRVSPWLAFLAQWMPWLVLPVSGPFFRSPQRAGRMLNLAAKSWVGADRACLQDPEVAQTMAAALAEALHAGARGAAYDGMLLGRAWGFQPEQVSFPNIHLWHGERDGEVPVAAARETARRLPHCRATFYGGEGHISVIATHAEEIIEALAAEPQSS